MAPGTLEQITRHYESGQMSAARESCRILLQQATIEADTLRQLGLIALRADDPATTVDVMQRALLIRPDDAEYHSILGSGHRELGELKQAAQCFLRATELAGECAEVHNNYGACLFELGDIDAAIFHYQRALELDPWLPAAHYNLGNVRQLQGRLDDAVVCYRQALGCQPDYAEAHANLGAALHQQRRYTEAVVHYRRSLELRPDNPETHNNLGALYHEQKQFALAVECYARALKLNKEYLNAQVNWGDALRDQGRYEEAAGAYRRALDLQPAADDVRDKLGVLLQALGDLAGAEECYRVLVQHMPESIEVRNDLGVVLHLQGKTGEAVACYEEALALSADHPDTYTNLAATLREQGDLENAVKFYERALRLQPDSSRAHLGLADVFCDRRCLDDARTNYELALILEPDNPDIHLYCALSFLRMGDFQRGWREFEWRLKIDQYGPRDLPLPRWNGEPLDGRKILIHGEQGLGDTIQFVRYLTLVKQSGGELLFACRDSLLPLLEHIAGVDQLLALGQPLPPCDLHAPLLSLPLILGTTLESIPADTPYLQADAGLVNRWWSQLSGYDGLRIGVCWQGNPRHRRDKFRSIPLQFIEELCGVEGITVIGLQKECSSRPLRAGTPEARFVDLSQEIDIESGPFMDTAAIMTTLDVMITCDTSLAHLAGALGVPVWVALDFFADWRWLLDRDDSPWYPTMRLVRQRSPGDWADVFRRIREALKGLANH